MFLEEFYDLIEENIQDDVLIDFIFDEVDRRLGRGKFEEIDRILHEMDFEKVRPLFLITFLTATGSSAVKKNLSQRAGFYHKTKAKLVELKKVDPDKILDGLE